MKKAVVNRIVPFSCVDGPGNRMALFFQGCPFRCTYCHNPETISLCSHCGLCVPACPSGALEIRQGRVLWNRDRCTGCDSCLKACPSLSTPKTAEYTPAELLEEIRAAAPFLSGITCSGGECTLQADFLADLFALVREELDLTCFIDTNGCVDLSGYPSLTDRTDAFMLDIKAWGEEEHTALTGQSNRTVLKNLRYLLKEEKLHEVRTVIVPGLDNERTVREVSRIIGDACPYKLIPYRKYGVRPEGLAAHGETGPGRAEMEGFRELARTEGAARVLITEIPD